MKNYNEITDNLLKRRDQYVIEQKLKRKKMVGAASSFCGLCLIALVGFGIWQAEKDNTIPPINTTITPVSESTTATTPDIELPTPNTDAETNDTLTETTNTPAVNPNPNNKIVINPIKILSIDMQGIALFGKDFIEMDKTALNEYYGINVFPTIPDDIKEWPDQRFGIYKRNNGTGEIYWDGNVLNYSNDDFSRSVNIEIDKGTLPFCDYLFYEPTEEKSIINNVEMIIGQTDNGYYYAEFIYHNTGFRIVGEGLTQDEFVAIISSLVV